MKTRSKIRNCLDTAVRLLARRDHSYSELARKLTDRGFSQEQIKRALDECLRLHYLDDERYAAVLAEHLQRKGYGCLRIQQVLAAKGVAGRVITACLENLCRENIQIQHCRQVILKKLKGNQRGEGSVEARARLYRFLFNRGFPPGIIRQAMDGQDGSVIPDAP